MMKISLRDIFHYCVGNLMYEVCGCILESYVPRFLREQYLFRQLVMRSVCYDGGSCVECGCMTTALQHCGKGCAGFCYPRLMWPLEWDRFMLGLEVYASGHSWRMCSDRGLLLVKCDGVVTGVWSLRKL